MYNIPLFQGMYKIYHYIKWPSCRRCSDVHINNVTIVPVGVDKDMLTLLS